MRLGLVISSKGSLLSNPAFTGLEMLRAETDSKVWLLFSRKKGASTDLQTQVIEACLKSCPDYRLRRCHTQDHYLTLNHLHHIQQCCDLLPLSSDTSISSSFRCSSQSCHLPTSLVLVLPVWLAEVAPSGNSSRITIFPAQPLFQNSGLNAPSHRLPKGTSARGGEDTLV